MKKFLYSLLMVFLFTVAILAWVFIPTHENIGPQTVKTPLDNEFTLVAHRVLSTDPDAGSKFAYFVVTQTSDINDLEPFLVTSDQFARIEKTGDNSLSLTVNGRIYQYHNDLWVNKTNGQLQRWYVSINARYLR
ncbi:hypothetical protein ACPV4B_13385 [Vibrio parahaemolyticus]|uniref:hypothetical protein n=1 Tax=Vibrio mediterranei TaxID=689 RepID=UPI004068C378